MFRLSLVAVAALLAAAAPSRATEECPASGLDRIETVLREAPTCARAMALLRACALGASGDVVLGAAVTERCERDFLGKLTVPHRQAYERAKQRCAGKHRNQSGTMYRSLEAFCGAELAQSYARRQQKAAAGGDRRKP